ncbi:MAG TPA: hypothetical protein VFF33_12510 [Ignavibacteriaceae bacterium]|nr:hypothetical protein [Ignavibacteriaceae bacterium]
MSKMINDEMLSAYLDNELNEKDKLLVEENLLTSSELRTKLEELKKIKFTVKESARSLPESPYFETRLEAALKDNSKQNKLRKFAPAIGFSALAIFLMILFRLNPNFLNTIVEEQKTNIAGFYTENLKPLLFAANIDNEDIFNFAFNKQLPLDDRNNQVLLLGYDPKGVEYFEIKQAGNLEQPNNLDNFIRAMNFTNAEKEKVYQILQSYADDIQSQILVNDRNTVAINPNLWNYNQAIVADICKFAAQVNKPVLQKIMPAAYTYYSDPQVIKAINKAKEDNNEYIFFTPDTVFSEKFYFDKEKFKEDMKQMKKDMSKNMEELNINLRNMKMNLDSSRVMLKDRRHNNDIRVFIDTNSYRVELHNFNIPDFDIELPNMDSINALVEKEMKNLKSFSFVIPDMDEKGKRNFSFKYRTDDSSGEVNVVIPNIDSIVQLQMKNMPKMDSLMKHFSFRTDSSGRYYFDDDSLGINFPGEDFKTQMKMLEKEMKKFQKEMQELRKELKKKEKDSQDVEVRAPLEI